MRAARRPHQRLAADTAAPARTASRAADGSDAMTSLRPRRRAPPKGVSPPARPSRRDPDLLKEAKLVDLAEDGARLEQLGLGALGDDSPVLEDDDSVGE